MIFSLNATRKILDVMVEGRHRIFPDRVHELCLELRLFIGRADIVRTTQQEPQEEAEKLARSTEMLLRTRFLCAIPRRLDLP